jgi:hypothetical protein
LLVRVAVAAGEDLPVRLAAGEALPVRGAAPGRVAAPVWLAVAVAESLAVPVACGVVDIDGDAGVKIAGDVGPGELVHAETAAETRTVKVTQLTAVSLALAAVPGGIIRTFMKPPYIPGGRLYR